MRSFFVLLLFFSINGIVHALSISYSYFLDIDSDTLHNDTLFSCILSNKHPSKLYVQSISYYSGFRPIKKSYFNRGSKERELRFYYDAYNRISKVICSFTFDKRPDSVCYTYYNDTLVIARLFSGNRKETGYYYFDPSKRISYEIHYCNDKFNSCSRYEYLDTSPKKLSYCILNTDLQKNIIDTNFLYQLDSVNRIEYTYSYSQNSVFSMSETHYDSIWRIVLEKDSTLSGEPYEPVGSVYLFYSYPLNPGAFFYLQIQSFYLSDKKPQSDYYTLFSTKTWDFIDENKRVVFSKMLNGDL